MRRKFVAMLMAVTLAAVTLTGCGGGGGTTDSSSGTTDSSGGTASTDSNGGEVPGLRQRKVSPLKLAHPVLRH